MKIAMVGQGGHSKVIKDIILSNKDNQIIGYMDDCCEKVIMKDPFFLGPVLTIENLIANVKDIKFIVAIGDNKVRRSIVEKLNLPKKYFVTLVHQSAIISPSAKIGAGTVVMANSVIQADAQIGHHSIINTSSVIEHDNQLGNFVHVSPHATLTGSVTIANGVHVGAGATVIPNKTIGEWSVIGAGATVIHNIPAYSLAVGVPAMVKKNQEQKEVSNIEC